MTKKKEEFATLLDSLPEDLKKKVQYSEKAPPMADDITDQDVERWADCNLDYPAMCYIMVGIGDGRHLVELYAKANPQAAFIVIENDSTRLKRAFIATNLSPLIMDERLIIFHQDDKIDVINKIGLVMDRITRGFVCCRPFTAEIDCEFQHDIMSKMVLCLEAHRMNVATQFNNSQRTTENLFDNMGDYVKGKPVAILKDAYKGKPAILVAAGPSVDKQIGQLKDCQKNAVVIACLTMLKPLLDNGITPDFVTALDYHEVSGRFLEGVEGPLPDTIFVMEPKVNHAVISAINEVSDQTLFVASDWLDFLVGRPLMSVESHVGTGSTVAHFCFALAEYMGCDPIVMTGLDLSFPLYHYYPQCVLKAHHWKMEALALSDPAYRQLLMDKDAKGNQVFYDEQMLSYKEQFELMWWQSQAKVIDCTEGGLKKRYVDETIAFDKAIEQYASIKTDKDVTYDNIDIPDKANINSDIVVQFKNLKDLLRDYIMFQANVMDKYLKFRDDPENKAIADEITKYILDNADVRQRIVPIEYALEMYSGIAGAIRGWFTSRETVMKDEVTADERITRDINYHTTMLNAARRLKKQIEKWGKYFKDQDN